MATWAVVKAQARDLLGINLTDADVTNVPLLATDAVRQFPARAQRLPAGRDGRRTACRDSRRCPGRGQPGQRPSVSPTPSAPATPSSTTSPTARRPSATPTDRPRS
ncbi:MAG: hypothetical protein M0C28_31850 [Candidatus Moduliflexus flocculans]|nr:hypothetical protein [Candidatus Moduliflexus flocculans]